MSQFEIDHIETLSLRKEALEKNEALCKKVYMRKLTHSEIDLLRKKVTSRSIKNEEHD